MPWSIKDYPASLKNLENPVKKKAIDIANAMIDEGYEDGRAIPIATSKAKEWAENASKKEIDDFLKNGDETEHDEDQAAAPAPSSWIKQNMSSSIKTAGRSKPRMLNVYLRSRVQRKKQLNGQRRSQRIKALK